MGESLMSKKEMLAYVAVMAISVAVLYVTMLYHAPNIFYRLLSLIPSGIAFAVLISMTVGIASAASARRKAGD